MWDDQTAGETSGETEVAFQSKMLNKARKSVACSILNTPVLQVQATCVASDRICVCYFQGLIRFNGLVFLF